MFKQSDCDLQYLFVRDLGRSLFKLVFRYIQLKAAVLFFILCSPLIAAEEEAKKTNLKYKNELKSAFVYNFLKYTRWSKEDELQRFSIAFLGSDEHLFTAMVEMFSRETVLVRGKKVKVKRVTLDTFDPAIFQVLFISDSHSKYLSSVARQAQRSNTLLVTEGNKDKRDIMMNLVTNGRRFAVEINRTNLVFEGLKTDQKLLEHNFIELDAEEVYKEVQYRIEAIKEELYANEVELKQTELDLAKQQTALNRKRHEAKLLNLKIAEQQNWLITAVAILAVFIALIIVILRINKSRLKSNQSLKIAMQELEKLSLTDQLTNAHNRRFLENIFPAELAKLKRGYYEQKDGAPKDYGFILIDSDHFKQVNDTYGHEAGDRVLIQFVEIFNKTCRDSDWVIRWGGEEFLIVGQFANRNELETLAERIRVNVENHQFDIGSGKSLHRTCSFGLAKFPFIQADLDALSWEQTIHIADIALYAAKYNGRNAWVNLHENNIPANADFFHHIQENIQLSIDSGLISFTTSIVDRKMVFGGD